MSFWTATHGIGNKEPKRAFRFKIIFNGLADDSGYVWFAKKVAKPKFEISETEHTFLTHKFFYPGRVTWSEIDLTLVDPVSPGATAQLNALLDAQGYAIPADPGGSYETMSKGKGTAAVGNIQIEQLDSSGMTIERWTLNNPWIKGIQYGELDYGEDGIVEITLTLRYDWAQCEILAGDSTHVDDQNVGADTGKIGTVATPQSTDFFNPEGS
tara:strand:+ start:767 stop:1402 length:636 start_codon:yes stop_codon:yes gene_type:complete